MDHRNRLGTLPIRDVLAIGLGVLVSFATPLIAGALTNLVAKTSGSL